MPKATMQNDIRQQMADALRFVHRHRAERVANAASDVEPYPASFLKHHRIYRIEYHGAFKPDVFYVGFAPGKRAYLLTPYPENYVALARADGVVIDSPETAAAYATVYVEVTRSMSSLTYLVNSVDEMKFRPNLTAEQEEIKRVFIEKQRSVITSPTATRTASGYAVTAYVVHEQALQQHRFNVSSDGDIQGEVRVVEEGLPLVYGG
jgi:hypothetical protein